MAAGNTKKRKSSGIVAIQEDNPDPRQALFLSLYLDPKSDTFSNALQSALAAKYSREYAESITAQMPAWLSENLGKNNRVRRAEAHLDEMLDMPVLIPAMGAFGPIVRKIPTGNFKKVFDRRKKKMVKVEIMDEEPVMVYSSSLIREKNKVMEFTLEALARPTYGKEKGSPGVPVAIQINVNDDRAEFA